VSVSYRAASGRLATVPTAGPDGAYLFVVSYVRGRLQGEATVGTGVSGGPIVGGRYRDGYTCATAGDHT
jgi:hypothetical protein